MRKQTITIKIEILRLIEFRLVDCHRLVVLVLAPQISNVGESCFSFEIARTSIDCLGDLLVGVVRLLRSVVVIVAVVVVDRQPGELDTENVLSRLSRSLNNVEEDLLAVLLIMLLLYLRATLLSDLL